MNKLVSLKLMTKHLEYKLYNSLNYHIQDNLIRFNSAYEKLKQKLVRIKILQNTSRNWKNKYKIARNDKMHRWKIHQKCWKLDFLERKYQKKSEHILTQNHMKKHQESKRRFQTAKWTESCRQNVNRIYRVFCFKNYMIIMSARKWFNFNHEKFITHEKS